MLEYKIFFVVVVIVVVVFFLLFFFYDDFEGHDLGNIHCQILI